MNTDISEGNIMIDNNSMVRYCILGFNNNEVFIMNELLNWSVVSIEECMDSEFIRNESFMSIPYFIKHCVNESVDLTKFEVVMDEFEKFKRKGK